MSLKSLFVSAALVVSTVALSGCVGDTYGSSEYDSYGRTYGSGTYVSGVTVYDRSPRYRYDDRYDRRGRYERDRDRYDRDRYDRDRYDRRDRDDRDRRRSDNRPPRSPDRNQARPAPVQNDAEIQDRLAAENAIREENLRIQRQRTNSR